MSFIPAVFKHPLARSLEVARGAVGGLAWGPAVTMAKSTMLAVLSRIEIGTLLLVDNMAMSSSFSARS